MNTRWIILFAVVAEERSFTKAAARLRLAQPWLSAQIRKLEASIGLELFTRTRTGVELTADGQRLYPAAHDMAEAADRFRTGARLFEADRSRAVKVGSYAPGLAHSAFARLNDDFGARYRQFSLEISYGPTDALLQQLRDGLVDLVLIMTPFDDAGLESILLRQLTPYILAPAQHAVTRELGVEVNSLAGLELGVAPRRTYPDFYDRALAPLEQQGVLLRNVPEADPGAMEHFVRNRRTPVIMTDGEIERYRDASDLAAIQIIDFPVPIQHHLVRLRNGLGGRAADRYWRLAQTIPA